MNYNPRILKRELRKATAHFPALLVTGITLTDTDRLHTHLSGA